MKRVYVDQWEVSDMLIKLIQDETYYIAGNSSWFVPSHNTKYLVKGACKPWPDCDGEVLLRTPGEAARIELNRQFAPIGRKHSFASKWTMKLLDKQPPMYWRSPVHSTNGAYIDLTSAYWQVYRWLPLDVLWPRGTGSPRWSLYPVAQRLRAWKTARNSIAGISRSSTIRTVKGKVIKDQKFRNPYLAPMLWMTIMDVIHDIASMALECGAAYIATDGYLFPHKWKAYTFTKTLNHIGLDWHGIEGELSIIGWGAYAIVGRDMHTHEAASKVTSPYKSNRYGRRPIDNVRPDTLSLRSLSFWRTYKDETSVAMAKGEISNGTQ